MLELDPAHAAAVLELGIVEGHAGNWVEARERFEAYYELDGSFRSNERFIEKFLASGGDMENRIRDVSGVP